MIACALQTSTHQLRLVSAATTTYSPPPLTLKLNVVTLNVTCTTSVFIVLVHTSSCACHSMKEGVCSSSTGYSLPS